MWSFWIDTLQETKQTWMGTTLVLLPFWKLFLFVFLSIYILSVFYIYFHCFLFMVFINSAFLNVTCQMMPSAVAAIYLHPLWVTINYSSADFLWWKTTEKRLFVPWHVFDSLKKIWCWNASACLLMRSLLNIIL